MADVSPHCAPRQDCKFLEYYSALAARLSHQFTVAVNRAFGRTDESGHRLEQCGLAAATGPDQSDELAGANLQVDYAGRLYRPIFGVEEVAEARYGDFFCVSGSVHRLFQYNASGQDRKSTRLNSSHLGISYAVF